MQQTADTQRTLTRPVPRAGTGGGGRLSVSRLWVPGPRHMRVDRAVRWALVAVSIGLLLLGINP